MVLGICLLLANQRQHSTYWATDFESGLYGGEREFGVRGPPDDQDVRCRTLQSPFLSSRGGIDFQCGLINGERPVVGTHSVLAKCCVSEKQLKHRLDKARAPAPAALRRSTAA